MGNASGIYNLMRNLGGSIAIAAVTTIIDRASQAHQAVMVMHLTPFDPIYQERLAPSPPPCPPIPARGSRATQAPAVIYGIVQQQSQLAAFVDNFQLFGIICLVCVPLVFLFKKVQTGRAKVDAD